jgi:hypothetical protein
VLLAKTGITQRKDSERKDFWHQPESLRKERLRKVFSPNRNYLERKDSERKDLERLLNLTGIIQKGKTQKGKTQKGKTQKGKTQKGKTQKGKNQKGKTQKGFWPLANIWNASKELREAKTECYARKVAATLAAQVPL